MTKSVTLIGLLWYPSNPAAMIFCRSSLITDAVMARTEPGERRSERVALGKDGPPREPRFEGLQRELLEQPALVEHGNAPLLIVVALKERVAVAPAARAAHHVNMTGTFRDGCIAQLLGDQATVYRHRDASDK